MPLFLFCFYLGGTCFMKTEERKFQHFVADVANIKPKCIKYNQNENSKREPGTIQCYLNCSQWTMYCNWHFLKIIKIEW